MIGQLFSSPMRWIAVAEALLTTPHFQLHYIEAVGERFLEFAGNGGSLEIKDLELKGTNMVEESGIRYQKI